MFTSIPQNLIQYYHIPDRNGNNPIHIGVFEWNSYMTKNNAYDYFNDFMKGYPNNPTFEQFTNFIENNVEFIDYNNINTDTKEHAQNVWNNPTDTSLYGQGLEASLDIQVIIGICKLGLHPDDKLSIFIGPGYSDFFTDTLFNYLNDDTIKNKAKIWSNSYGGPASYLEVNMSKTISSLSKNHYQIFVGSGDDGSTDNSDIDNIKSLDYYIQPDQPGMFPYITSVGGTTIYNNKEYPSILSKNQTIDAGFTSGGGMENTFLKSDGTSIINPYFNEDYISLYKNSEENIENYIKAEYNTTSKEIYKGFLKKIIEYGDSKGNTYPRGYPDVALSSTNYLIYMTDNTLTSYLASQSGTSASSPLMASIYAVISSNLDIPETYYGQLNSQLFDAYNNDIWRKKVFNPVCSYDNTTDNSGVINVNGTIQTLDAGWGIAQNRLSTANKNSSDYGYGFDFIVGLGSINATELQNYIESTISSNKNYISSININNNNLVIYYN